MAAALSYSTVRCVKREEEPSPAQPLPSAEPPEAKRSHPTPTTEHAGLTVQSTPAAPGRGAAPPAPQRSSQPSPTATWDLQQLGRSLARTTTSSAAPALMMTTPGEATSLLE